MQDGPPENPKLTSHPERGVQYKTRRHDAALIIPMGAALLMLPPVAGFFARPHTLFGLPLVVVYIFGLWLILIAVGFSLSRLLQRQNDSKHMKD